jgi:hypothetical protein
MKFKSATLNVRETTVVKLRAGLELTIASLPMGVEREFQAIFPKPQAPFKEIARVGQSPLREYNYEDSDFDAKFSEWISLRGIYYIWRCIYKIDANVEFEFTGETIDGIRGVANEFKYAGFTDNDLAVILRAVHKLSSISEQDLEDAKKSF